MTEFSRFAGAPGAPASQSRTFEPENSERSGLRERLGADCGGFDARLGRDGPGENPGPKGTGWGPGCLLRSTAFHKFLTRF